MKRLPLLEYVLMSLLTLALCSAGQRVMAQGTTSYVYDDNGRLRAVIAPTGEVAIYDYDPAGNFTAIRRLTANDLELFSFTPHQGVPGDLVTFTGVGFGAGVSSVLFNGVAAQVLNVTPSTVVAEVPQGATTGPVVLTTPHGSLTTPVPFTIRGVRVTPSTIRVLPHESVQFTATVVVEGDQSLRWSVNEIEGGNAAVGTISPGGLYVASTPALSDPSATFFIRATSVATPELFGEARVTVLNPEFINVALAPSVSVRNGNILNNVSLAAMAVSVRNGNVLTNIMPLSAGVSVRNGNVLTNIMPLSAGVSVRNGNVLTNVTPLSDGVSVHNGNVLTNVTPLSYGVSVTTGPVISAVAPAQIARGATVTITIAGANLNGTTGIKFIDASDALDANIVASNLIVGADGSSLTATITVGGDGTVGRHVVLISTATAHSLTVNVGTNSIEIIP